MFLMCESDMDVSQVSLVNFVVGGDLFWEYIVLLVLMIEWFQFIQCMVVDQLGDVLLFDFLVSVLQFIFVQVGGFYLIFDVWYIDFGVDIVECLCIYIVQFVCEIVGEVDLDECIDDCVEGIGFVCWVCI